jgi:diacylglycerol kinase (ATP)
MDFKKFRKSFNYAIEGIHFALHSDQNLVIHFIVAFLVIIASILLGLSAFEMAILGLTMILVITVEMINTAIEKVVDLIIQQHHINAKVAKDIASGMVFITAVGSIIVGLLIFLPHVFALFR